MIGDFLRLTTTALFTIGLFTQSPLIYAAECSASHQEVFADFFNRFSSEKKFAVSRTIYPLRVLLLEFGLNDKLEDDYSSSFKLKLTSKAEDSKYPSLGNYMNDNGLVAETNIKTRTTEVHVFKPDTDWSVMYRFLMKKHCWYLHEIEDDSL
ncbi:hypothetical protein A7981_06525 [Methylovorus sp. MM2]|nr:hypothetical protein A7981_06525 [Methylovorus sp. MM2]